MEVIAFHAARLRLGGRLILADANFVIGAGEFIGVLGANGAGKTTLMRAILGLVPPDHGTISVFGRPAARGNPRIGYVPQTRTAITSSRIRGWDFVAGVLKGPRLGLPILGKADRMEVERALSLVDGRQLAARPMAELSGGERQRLLLAQALVDRPDLLLLDEPLASLDPRYQQSMVALVRAVQEELGISVLFSAHDLNPLLSVMSRVLYLGGGQAALGTVDEVITGPTLSRLYGSAIDVIRLQGRIFVMAGDQAAVGATQDRYRGAALQCVT